MSGSTTGTVRIHTAAGGCVHSPVDCDDQNSCTVDRCNPETGQCEHAVVGCDDGNPCTRDSCDSVSGACQHDVTQGAACDDGNACTRGDSCNADGRCVGEPLVCNDDNPCTADACVDGQCVFSPTVGASCNDGNACTTEDRCVQTPAGVTGCQGTPVGCDDGNSCTADSCDPRTGCVHASRAVLQPVCSFSPGTLNLNSQGTTFSVNLSIVDSCDPANPVPISPGSIGIVHVSRAGSLVLPDPASLQCPAVDGSTSFETGLFDDLATRSVLGSS